MPPSPPRLARKLNEEQTDLDPDIQTNGVIKSPARTQNHQISDSTNNTNKVDEALMAASNRLDFSEDLIFLTNSTSSDEFEHSNESESDTMSRMKSSSSSPYSSPQQYERRPSPSKVGHIAMKSPGMSIPTPAMAKQRETSCGSYVDDFAGPGFPFPRPLSMHSSQMREMNITTPDPKNLSTQFEECEGEDDSAFLPDDFDVAFSKPKQDEATFTFEEVERKIREAKREERLSLRKQHESETEECHKEFEKVLIESGSQWKMDADEQEARYQKLLKEERHKTSLKHHELINKAQSLQDVKENMKELEAERELLNLRVKGLESNEEKINIAASKTQELESLRKDKINAENCVSKLESEINGVVEPLKLEKETADRKAAELSEQLREVTESSDQSKKRLEEALNEIMIFKGQLAELPSRHEVENLRNLRVEDGKEIEALQNQMSEIVDEHRDVFTPQKKGINTNHFESPCVGEIGVIDVLRVDYDKAQVQLKAMGKVLKRYKTERDDLKNTISELEQRHIQAIKIAVKQATRDQKKKLEFLTEENNSLRQHTKYVGEKVEEIKNRMENLKQSHEEEAVRLRDNLDDETKNSEEQQKILKAQLEMENMELKEKFDKKIESLNQEMQQLRTKQNDELSLVNSSSKEQVESLQDEMQQLRIVLSEEFENEKIGIIQNKTRECEALEGQIKTMNEMHSEELELFASESREEVDSLKKTIVDLQKLLDSKSSGALTEDVVIEMKTNFEDTLKELKGITKVDKDNLLNKISSLKEEKDAEIKRASKFETQIVEIKAQNAARVEKIRDEYVRQIREVKSAHASESEELLSQLDLIEAEAAQRFKNAETAVTEKDAVITALGSQVAESESRSAATSKEYEVLNQEIESLRSDLEIVSAANEERQKEVTNLIERHKKEIADQISMREGACNEAREEMIALAEGQLAERQEYYQALKRELDNAQSKISVLERDLRFATKELEEMGRRHEAREADLRDELAQSKAAIATKEAGLIRVDKLHQVELDRARGAEKAIKTKYEQSQATSHSIQKTLAALVTEKQRLEQELTEVTAISEELATLCEKNKLM